MANKPPKTLTEIFQQQTNGKVQKREHRFILPSEMPPSKVQIVALRKMLSKPTPALDIASRGGVNNSRNPKRDRKIIETMQATQQALKNHKDMARSDFAKTGLQNKAKIDFNRSAGFGM